MKRISVLTSGGDLAGMNAAIRAVVRTGLDNASEGSQFGWYLIKSNCGNLRRNEALFRIWRTVPLK